MVRAFLLVLVAYATAGIIAVGTGVMLHNQPPIIVVGAADLAATIVIFLFSVLVRNSSMYDPYWSVAPVPIALYWLVQPSSNGLANPRHVLIVVLVCLWALRLTANWASQWRGLEHEDWRYRDIKQQTGRFYWPVSLLGIHLLPTILVFGGCLALWPTLSDRNAHLTWLDGVAALVTLTAIVIEATADRQMRRFRRSLSSAQHSAQRDANAIPQGAMPRGWWSVSRHPNYFGEVLFWWGLYLFVPLAYPAFRLVILGPVLILGLFLGVSIPLMERHLIAGHPTYGEYQRHVVSPFFPWFARARRAQQAPLPLQRDGERFRLQGDLREDTQQ
jgi:steroid 5-alpha reductase family enzyme